MSQPVFAASSALVKLYADEPHAELVRDQPLLVVSQLARVEVPAALWRKSRMGELSRTDARTPVGAFEADYLGEPGRPARLSAVVVSEAILGDAARLAGTHGLRAYVSVQLASACATRTAVPEGIVFAAFDKALCDAAVMEGLPLLTD